jgi:hypothetical protein
MTKVEVAFDQADLSALAALLDAAVKATGMEGAKLAVPIFDKINAAVQAANQTRDQKGQVNGQDHDPV